MPRPTRSYGRPGTRVVPVDWETSHGPVTEGAMTAVVSLRHDGTATTWSATDKATVPVAAAPYASGVSARIQAQRQTALEAATETATETVRVTGYLVTLRRDLDPAVGDLIHVDACSDDAFLTGATLRISEVVGGSLRFERDVFANLVSPVGGVPA